MYENFLSIPKEKQERIINAAFKEFALNGYEKASTNAIVEEAGISKGLLFHYFENKKKLFFYLLNYFMDTFVDELYALIDVNETDFFERVKRTTLEKMKLVHRHPAAFRFIEKAYVDSSEVIMHEVSELTKMKAENLTRLYENIDYSLFKPGIDVEKALKIIMWSFEGYGNEIVSIARLTEKPIDYDVAFAQVEEYIDILKTAFYK